MNITPPGDDLGVQRLRLADNHREVKETGKIDAYPRIESSEERHEPKPVQPLDRRKQQRRKRQRRQFSQRGLLDTRDGHERRQLFRRQTDQPTTDTTTGAPPAPLPGHGIDERV